MSKESTAGFPCKCGVRIYYQEYHWPHCPENPNKQKETDGLIVGKKVRQPEAGKLLTMFALLGTIHERLTSEG